MGEFRTSLNKDHDRLRVRGGLRGLRIHPELRGRGRDLRLPGMLAPRHWLFGNLGIGTGAHKFGSTWPVAFDAAQNARDNDDQGNEVNRGGPTPGPPPTCRVVASQTRREPRLTTPCSGVHGTTRANVIIRWAGGETSKTRIDFCFFFTQIILDLGQTSGRLGAGRRRGEARRGSGRDCR